MPANPRDPYAIRDNPAGLDDQENLAELEEQVSDNSFGGPMESDDPDYRQNHLRRSGASNSLFKSKEICSNIMRKSENEKKQSTITGLLKRKTSSNNDQSQPAPLQ